MKSFLMAVGAIVFISAGMLANIYEALNISESDAKKCLLASIGEGFIIRGEHHDLVSDARKLSVEERVAGIKELMRLAKEYTATDDFKKDYKKWRNNKLNPDSKGKFGLPKLGKMLDNAVDNKIDKSQNEKNYPSDATEMVKKRLTDFLEVSATVDFDAALNGNRFANPEYEKKSSWWKMCYRAGKPVIEAAREEAQKWLDELKSK
jgi:hypothetical protein